jgi:hypothetical protein
MVECVLIMNDLIRNIARNTYYKGMYIVQVQTTYLIHRFIANVHHIGKTASRSGSRFSAFNELMFSKTKTRLYSQSDILPKWCILTFSDLQHRVMRFAVYIWNHILTRCFFVFLDLADKWKVFSNHTTSRTNSVVENPLVAGASNLNLSVVENTLVAGASNYNLESIIA